MKCALEKRIFRTVAEVQNIALSLEGFLDVMSAGFAEVVAGGQPVAVGVSGGPDSMALVKLLCEWAEHSEGPEIHALIVDHGLRSESMEEAETVLSSLQGLHYVKSSILRWEGKKPEAAVQEEARKARYRLMTEYCESKDIAHLFLAHHMDDQAETFLFRLAKGSGLDGLCAMSAQQKFGGVTLCRPLLGVSKARLVATCDHYGLVYVQDPSNESEDFARVRLRKSMSVLAGEGLSVKRLAITARRMRRAREALEIMADKAFMQSLIKKETDRIVLNYVWLAEWPDDIALRVVLKAIGMLRSTADYAPRMEKIEALFCALVDEAPFRKRTLGGLVFERDDREGHVIITKEM